MSLQTRCGFVVRLLDRRIGAVPPKSSASDRINLWSRCREPEVNRKDNDGQMAIE